MWFMLRSLGFQRFVAEGQRDIVHYIRLNLIKRDARSLARSLVKLRSDRSHDTSTFSFSGWKLSCGAVCRIIESGEEPQQLGVSTVFCIALRTRGPVLNLGLSWEFRPDFGGLEPGSGLVGWLRVHTKMGSILRVPTGPDPVWWTPFRVPELLQ